MSDYTLYELTPRGGSADRFSPYTWRTLSDLALLDIPYKSVPYQFSQIRKDLAAATGNDNVTVPTLQGAEGYVTGSFDVADYLDKKHPGVLFPDASSRSLGFFLDQWTDTELIPIIRELFRPLFYLLLDAEGRAYYLAVKNGPPAAAPALVSRQIRALDDPNAVAHLGAAGRAKLQIFENLLAKTDGPFVLGAKASHADSAVFGWYVSSQVNAETVNRELWQHASLPNIARWAKAMEKATKFVSPFSTKLTAELKDEALKELEK